MHLAWVSGKDEVRTSTLLWSSAGYAHTSVQRRRKLREMSTLQEAQDASYQDAFEAEAAWAEGLRAHPGEVDDLVELRIKGCEERSGHARGYETQIVTRMMVKDGTINWRRFGFKKLYLSAPSHFFLLQGASIVQFFSAGSLLIKEKTYEGPLLYIAGRLSEPWEAPAYITGLVLGQLMRVNKSKINVMETYAALALWEARRRAT